jgi:hypothetical protein
MKTFQAVVPLLTVLLTAVLSGYVVPRITRRWQDHQKELEIKVSLVDEISNAVLHIILAMQFAERKASTQQEFDDAYREWEVRRAVLTARTAVYFPAVAGKFEELSNGISDFYALGGISRPDYREQQIAKLQAAFGAQATDWVTLADQEMRRDDLFTWFFAWWSLREAVLRRKDVIVRELLREDIAFLRSG